MSARKYGTEIQTNNTRAVDYCFSVTSVSGAASAPTFIEGDGFSSTMNGQGTQSPAVTSAGTFITITRTGVGVYVFTTTDPFPGFVAAGFQLAAATPAGQLTITCAPATQNANNTWSISISVFSIAAAHELAAGDYIYGWMRFRNGLNVP